jgi:hypothetical protein
MTARDIRHPHTGLKALRYNPGLHIIRPAPVTPRSTDDLNLPVETIRNIRHRRLLLLNQDETLSSAVNAKGGYPMGRKRRLLKVPLLGFEWVTLGKHSNHPIVRPGRPSLRPDLAA